MSGLRSRLRGTAAAVLLAGQVFLVMTPVPVMAATAEMRGSQMAQGFGRLVLSFDAAPKTTARVANGILIISFADRVTVATDRILRELPTYFSVVRADPDGRGLRFAMTKTHRVNVTEAGEKVFIDILPETWTGLPPGLPQEVIEELTQRARTAEIRAREFERKREREEPGTLVVRGSRLPNLTRLIFELPSTVPIAHQVDGRRIAVHFDKSLKADGIKIRPLLPEGVSLSELDSSPAGLKFSLTAPEGWTLRGFREDDGFIIDIARPVTRSSPETPAQAAIVKPAAKAVTEAAVLAPSAAAPVITGAPAQMAAPAPSLPRGEGVSDTKPEMEKAAQTVGFQLDAKTGARLDLTFSRRTALAALENDNMVTLVIDTADTIDPDALNAVLAPLKAKAEALRQGRTTLVRIALPQPMAARVSSEGNVWSIGLGDKSMVAAEALAPQRSADENGQTVLSVPVADASGVHWVDLDGAGRMAAIVTVFGKTRAIMKPFRFVEADLPQTAHGLVVLAKADDVVVRHNVKDVIIGRNGGLSLSLLEKANTDRSDTAIGPALVVDRKVWNAARTGSIRDKWREQNRILTEATRPERTNARLDYANFLLANELASEAIGPIKAVMADDSSRRTDRRARMLEGIAAVLMHRQSDGEAAFAAPVLADDQEALLWRALLDTRARRFGRAHSGFRRAAEMLDMYPESLQGRFREAALRSAIEQRDFSVAEREYQILAALPPEFASADLKQLLRAMLDEALSRTDGAIAGYKELFDSRLRPVAAEAQVRAASLAMRENSTAIPLDEAIARLETVAMIWRGDETEASILGELGRIYSEQQRWREAFQMAKKANEVFPEHPMTRRLHDETAKVFDELFSTGRSSGLSRVDTLALFYDFKQFLPIGRRGDEIIRRLADRLVELDLLDQAADLLQHQVDNRLHGAAKATVAAQLAMIRLMNRRPSEALTTLATSRLPELPKDVKRARLLLEAKALSDLSRTDLALELLSGEDGPEVQRLKADILWSGRRWREAGEVHEAILDMAWRSKTPLADRERADVMRAAVAYVMSDEGIQLDRLRTKYALKMAESPDARTFAFITGLDKSRPSDVRDLARSVAGADTVSQFMDEYRKRYPDYASAMRQKQSAAETKSAPVKPAETKPADLRAGSAPQASEEKPAPGQPTAAAPRAS
jgi:tetratricopeptide (TPR) repeat protein